jgi:hypothetical protein
MASEKKPVAIGAIRPHLDLSHLYFIRQRTVAKVKTEIFLVRFLT